jgi:Universal stress protein UspA and related nucleotide-binding proteins
MYDDIIVATDGEAGAAAALAAAVDLAVIHEATLHGIFVLDPRIYTAYSGDEYVDHAEGPESGLLERGESALAEVTMSADAVGLAHETHLLRGRPAQQIIETAESIDADLVVVGSTSHDEAYRSLLGSVAETVVRHCERPVLVVKS